MALVKIPNYLDKVKETEKEKETENLECEDDNGDFKIEKGSSSLFDFTSNSKPNKNEVIRKESILSDPDVYSDDDWSNKYPCPSKKREELEQSKRKGRKKQTLRKRKCKKIRRDKKKTVTTLKEDNLVKSEISETKVNKETMTECYAGEFDHLYENQQTTERSHPKTMEERPFEGNVQPLLVTIIKDLADEGYISASYPNVSRHPDIQQLIKVKLYRYKINSKIKF